MQSKWNLGAVRQSARSVKIENLGSTVSLALHFLTRTPSAPGAASRSGGAPNRPLISICVVSLSLCRASGVYLAIAVSLLLPE
uniref:Uncharacterized protein n=1 Tax=Aegilops tauschii subsp. strangulata TaxID=200361 RepID=A0A453CI21_AEGTS